MSFSDLMLFVSSNQIWLNVSLRMGLPLGDRPHVNFNQVNIESIRVRGVYSLQSDSPVNDNLMEILNALKRACAQTTCRSDALLWLCSSKT